MMQSAAQPEERTMRQRRWSLAVACASFFLVAAADLAAPPGVVAPVFYTVSIASLIWSRNRRLLWVCAIVAVLVTALVWLWGRPASAAGDLASEVNRILAIAAIVLIAVVGHLQMANVELADRRRESLRKQFAELEELNEQISQREEEIVRQNEELQSQSEELERQSEELRISNEELASWEKRLEQLLDLSRSLTAEIERGDMLKKICESLGLLSEGRPAVVLEKAGDQLRVICHYGFGPAGPLEESLPFSESFAALVMAVGQTAYVEDVQQRPELRLPSPRDGNAFRSILASPLLVRGRCIGTIEVFSTKPRVWEQADISMIESLAAQASVSLQGAELVDDIRRERRRFEAAFRTVPFGMAITDDPDCREVRINPAAAALFNISQTNNVSPHAPLGERLTRCLFRDDEPLPPGEHPLLRAARGEEIVQEEIELSLPLRPRATLLTSAAAVHDAEGKIVGAVCAFADVTLQKALQRELDLRRREAEEASVRKTRFLAAVSHDIRTPANAINLMVELMRRCAADPALAHEIPRLAGDLQRNTAALLELVGDMLDLARFDSGKVDLVETEFLLSQLVQEEVRQLMPLAEQKGLALRFVPGGEETRLRTDRVKLARVLGNLISNALKFTERGEVRVEIDRSPQPERRVLVRVVDTGVGIAAHDLASIFDEFTQMHNPARDRTKGSGLGLAICKRLLDVIGGGIEVASEPGRGSTFTVTLPSSCVAVSPGGAELPPAASPVQAARPATPPPSGPLLRLKLLLVEDHASTREGTAMLLRQEGATVIEAADGVTALAKISEEPFDAVLVDMMLPDLDGGAVICAVHNANLVREPAIFVLTGDMTPDRLAQIDALKVDAVIEKPIDLGALMGRLRALQPPVSPH